MTAPPKTWRVELYSEGGHCPIDTFIKGFDDRRRRALIVRKLEHLAEVAAGGVQNLKRPLVDTLDGPIKELVVDKQIRVLFSVEQSNRIILALEGTVKKNGEVDREAINKAKRERQRWLSIPESVPLTRPALGQ